MPCPRQKVDQAEPCSLPVSTDTDGKAALAQYLVLEGDSLAVRKLVMVLAEFHQDPETAVEEELDAQGLSLLGSEMNLRQTNLDDLDAVRFPCCESVGSLKISI